MSLAGRGPSRNGTLTNGGGAMRSGGVGGAGRGGEVDEKGDRRDATKADMDSMRILFQIVTRQFYDDAHVIFIDILSRYQVVPQDIMASTMGIKTQEVGQIANRLKADKLIDIVRKSEIKESTGPSNFQRSVNRSYLVLDPKMFLDVTHWRIAKMRSQIDSLLRNELDNKGYMCPRCRKSFGTLDVAQLLDPMTGATFICDTPGCGSELVDNEDAEDVKRSKDRLRRFNMQLEPILIRLRNTESLTLPEFDSMEIISSQGGSEQWRKRADEHLRRRAAAGESGSTLSGLLPPLTSASSGAGSRAGPSVSVDMTTTDPEMEAARRAERQAEVERMREQNALPVWLQQDVLGQRIPTRDQQREEAQRREAAALAGSNNNEESSGAGNMDDYYKQYASMAAEEGEYDDDDDDFVAVDTPANGTNTSEAQTPSGKRSREDSESTPATSSKRTKGEMEEGDDDDDDDFDEVA